MTVSNEYCGTSVSSNELRVVNSSGGAPRVSIADSALKWLDVFNWTPDRKWLAMQIWGDQDKRSNRSRLDEGWLRSIIESRRLAGLISARRIQKRKVWALRTVSGAAK